MTTTRILVLALVALLSAPAAFAARMVLTEDGVVYSVDASKKDAGADTNVVTLVRREGTETERLIVPATADDVRDSGAQLEYDEVANRLYVAWRRSAEYADEIVLASRDAAGEWSEPVVLARGGTAAVRDQLRIALTHSKSEDLDVAIVHAVWWRTEESRPRPEYALSVFDKDGHVYSETADLEKLAGVSSAQALEAEDTGEALYPPLTVAAITNGVEVVFGAEKATSLTRVRVEARKVPNARIWRPGKQGSGGVPPSRLVSNSTDSVQAIVGTDRIVLYTPGNKTRFTIYSNGRWTNVHSIPETLTPEQILNELHRLAGIN
jgi:hypothetical protein